MLVHFIKAPIPATCQPGPERLAEESRLDWEPLTLRLLAYRLVLRFGHKVEPVIWHLRSEADTEAWLAECRLKPPALVVFTEIDILVGSVSRLAARLKGDRPQVGSGDNAGGQTPITVVGGKQCSLLQPGNKFPFLAIDYAIAGCGSTPLIELVASLLRGERPERLAGLIQRDELGLVTKINPPADWDDLADIQVEPFRAIPLVGPSPDDYCQSQQRFPAPVAAPVRLATVLWSSGCPHACSFCQSPAERQSTREKVAKRPLSDIVSEISWLARQRGVNAIFALAANVDLRDMATVLEKLGQLGLAGLPISGFVRAADVVAAAKSGLLARLARLGLGVLSIGFDASALDDGEKYAKGFGRSTSLACLDLCFELGIPVSITVVGDSLLAETELKAELAALLPLPVLSVDVRLATALRGTAFYRQQRPFLLYDPEQDPAALDFNDYRHVTLRSDTGIEPGRVYGAVAEFRQAFAAHPARGDYARRMVGTRPELAPLFSAILSRTPPYPDLSPHGK